MRITHIEACSVSHGDYLIHVEFRDWRRFFKKRTKIYMGNVTCWIDLDARRSVMSPWTEIWLCDAWTLWRKGI